MPTASFSDFIKIAHQLPHPYNEIICEDGVPSGTEFIGSSASIQEMRQKTWRLFLRAVKDRFSWQQIEHVAKRYKFDINQMKNSTAPLKRYHLEYFGVKAATPDVYYLDKCLSWFFGPRNINSCNDEQIRKLVKHETRDSYLGDKIDPRDVKGGSSWFDHFKVNNFAMDQQRANLFLEIADVVSKKDVRIPRMHPYYSRLVMAILSKLETNEKIKDIGLLIPVPGEVPGQVNYYQIYDIISHGGLTAVALIPTAKNSSLPSLLAFCCTKNILSQTDSFFSVMNDLEQNIGESGYYHSEKKLDALMKDPVFTRRWTIDVLGYSLGGAHAGQFMEKHWRSVREFVGFNFVGNGDKTIENLAEQINKSSPHIPPPRFYIYRNAGDWVNKAGKKHLGWGITHPLSFIQVCEFNIDDYPVPNENPYDPSEVVKWLNYHAVRPMDSDREYEYTIYRGHTLCNPILDTYKLDHRMEDARMMLGNIFLRSIISFLYSVLDFIFRMLGIEFFRRNTLLQLESDKNNDSNE